MSKDIIEFIFDSRACDIGYINHLSHDYEWMSPQYPTTITIDSISYNSLEQFIIKCSGKKNPITCLKIGIWAKITQNHTIFNSLIMSGSHPLNCTNACISIFTMKFRKIFQSMNLNNNFVSNIQKIIDFIFNPVDNNLKQLSHNYHSYEWISENFNSKIVINSKNYPSLSDFISNYDGEEDEDTKLKFGLWAKYTQNIDLFIKLNNSGNDFLNYSNIKISIFTMKLREIFKSMNC